MCSRQKTRFATNVGGKVNVKCLVEAVPTEGLNFEWRADNGTLLGLVVGETYHSGKDQAYSDMDYTIR